MRRKKIFLYFSCFLFSGIALFPVTSPKRLTIVCAGDSLMRPMPVHLRRLWPSSRFRLRDWAQGGLSSATYLSFFLQHPDWRRERVDFILLQLGTNDVSLIMKQEEDASSFYHNLRAIVRHYQKLKSNFFRRPQILIATVPLFSGLEVEAARNEIVEKIVNPNIRILAQKEGLILVDQYAVLMNRPELYDPDGVHPNPEGERALARNWRRAVRSVWLSRLK